MLFQWNEQTFRWIYEASRYTGYDRELAKLLLSRIGGRTLCDMGCGMALADFELAPHLEHITCVDISPEAVDNVRARAEREGVKNITALCADGAEAEGSWDTVMALFHGTVEQIVPVYLKKARERLILVVHGSAYGSTGPKGYRVRKCSDTDGTAAWLDANGYRYAMERGSLEFGQPHRSFEDAVAYTRTFSKNAPEEELIAHVRQTVRETGREDYPLYTPKQRGFGIFVIGRKENEYIS